MTIAQQIGKVHTAIELSQKTREFVSLARCIALSKGDHRRAGEIAREARLAPTVQSVLDSPFKVYDADLRLQKAAVSAGTTSDATWALPLANFEVLASAFMAGLQNHGAFDRLLPSMRQVPMRVRVGAVTTGASGSTVGQGQSKPISRLTLSSGTIDETKVSVILALTDELGRFGDTTAGNLFATELSNAVAVATDSEFVSILASGASSIGSSGSTAEHVRNDLRGLLGIITTGARSQLFVLMTSAIAKVLSMLHTNAGDAAFPSMSYKGGQIGGVTAVVSDGVPASTMVLVDATQVAAASETVQLSATNEAAVQMDSAPDSPPSGSTPMVSLWQMNMTGLKAERWFGVEKLTTTGVAVLTSASYLGDSPGP